MEIREFARQVLLSTELSEKLFAPTDFTDKSPGKAISPPTAPGRPSTLPLSGSLPIPPAPTPAGIENEDHRGLALHTFAHHELQALELMALALLRFPHAPSGFRLGLARIILDEQRHFSLYRQRAEHWGTHLGDVGVGNFFWNTVAPLNSLTEFLAALSLTYEQANLDYAVYWKKAFEAVDDFDSAQVLQTVYTDEIRHVRHGVHWFRHLAGDCDFETYEKALVFPLSPGRAKGAVYNREGRKKAGLNDAFVNEMEIRNVSRGRPPRVFGFDPFVEDEMAGRKPKESVANIATDLSSIPMFLAQKEDVVLGPRPGLSTLLPLHRAGFAIPEFLPDLEALGDRALGEKCPWGWSPGVAETFGVSWNAQLKTLYDKTWALKCRNEFLEHYPSPLLLSPQGSTCHELSRVVAHVDQGGPFVAKSAFSTSGQHRILLESPVKQKDMQWLEKQLQNGPLVVEPWFQRKADVSIHVDVTDAGCRVVGHNRFWTVATGTYRGASIGHWTLGLSNQELRAIQQGNATDLLGHAGEFVGQRAMALGYRGPLGIDAMLVQTEQGLALLPILEVNPRYTMGRIALAIQKRCLGHGGWFFLSQKMLKQAGYSSAKELGSAIAQIPILCESGGLRSGVLFTTDPDASKTLLTVLCIAPTWQQARLQWEQLGFNWP